MADLPELRRDMATYFAHVTKQEGVEGWLDDRAQQKVD